MTTIDQARASLLDVASFLGSLPAPRAEAKADPALATHAFALAVMKDESMPISLLAPWASYDRFRQWEISGKLTLERRNGKVCVRPSAFFTFWNALPNERPRQRHQRRHAPISAR
jgi:hypothetical protein